MNSSQNDLLNNEQAWWEGAIEWLDEVTKPLQEIIADVKDPEISAWEKYVYDASESESWLEDQVMDVLYSTEREDLSTFAELTREGNIWFDERVWDTGIEEGWLEHSWGEFWDETIPEIIQNVPDPKVVIPKIIEPLTEPIGTFLEGAPKAVSDFFYNISLNFDALFDWFAEWSGTVLRDLLMIPAITLVNVLFDYLLPEEEEVG